MKSKTMWQPLLLLVLFQSDGVQQTNYLAQRYCQEAIRQISMLRPSAERDALIRLTEMVLTRDKWTSTAGLHFRQLPVGNNSPCPLLHVSTQAGVEQKRRERRWGVWFGRIPAAGFSANSGWIWQQADLSESKSRIKTACRGLSELSVVSWLSQPLPKTYIRVSCLIMILCINTLGF